MDTNQVNTGLQELSTVEAKEIGGGNVMHTIGWFIGRAYRWVAEDDMPPSTLNIPR